MSRKLAGMRPLWTAAGMVQVGFGFVGYLVPGMPGTVFLLGALYCFSRSSPRMEAWLLSHPWFGPVLSEWRRSGGIRRTLKIRIVAIILLACGLSAGVLVARERPIWVPICVVALGLVGVAVVVTRPEPAEAIDSETP